MRVGLAVYYVVYPLTLDFRRLTSPWRRGINWYHTGSASQRCATEPVSLYSLMAKYTKEFLEYEELADLAMSRGLIVESRDELVATLQQVSYYRLSAYWFQYKEEGSDNFVSNTTLDTVLDIYEFDHKLRSITFKAISAFEISLRNDILHTHAKKYGKFGYAVKDNLPNLIKDEHNLLLKKLSSIERKAQRNLLLSTMIYMEMRTFFRYGWP